MTLRAALLGAVLVGCAPTYQTDGRPAAPVPVRAVAAGAWRGELAFQLRAELLEHLHQLRQARFPTVDAEAVEPAGADVKLEGDLEAERTGFGERPSKILGLTARVVEPASGRTLVTYRLEARPAEVRSVEQAAQDLAGLVRRDFRPSP